MEDLGCFVVFWFLVLVWKVWAVWLCFGFGLVPLACYYGVRCLGWSFDVLRLGVLLPLSSALLVGNDKVSVARGGKVFDRVVMRCLLPCL